MKKLRRSEDRGHVNWGWLEAKHSFSFGSYRDPQHMGFRTLRVINQDRIQPQSGFDTHSHRDMEIITYILRGTLRHQDSKGNSSLLHAGGLQVMSAGRGIQHSEYNASAASELELVQIWIEPDTQGLPPSYQEASPQELGRHPGLQLLLSPQNHISAGGSGLKIHQEAYLYRGLTESHQELEFSTALGRHLWLQVLKGTLQVENTPLHAGDGLGMSGLEQLQITSPNPAEFLLFDLS